MKTHSTWGYDVVIPLVGTAAIIGFVIYQLGIPAWLAVTLVTVACAGIAIKYDQ